MRSVRQERSSPLKFLKLTPGWEGPLVDFLRALHEAGDSALFHPHPFTEEAIHDVIKQARKDVYCVLVQGQHILGDGMLRGWDDGYEVPGLGITLHLDARTPGCKSHRWCAAGPWRIRGNRLDVFTGVRLEPRIS